MKSGQLLAKERVDRESGSALWTLPMHATQRIHQPVQSAVLWPVSCQWVTSLADNVPLMRFVVPCEEGLEETLSNMSPDGAAELRSQYAMARCALEEGRWETALSSLLCCKDILKGEEARVGALSYGLLCLWAGYPLAQMYQQRGRAEKSAQMLQKAVETWSEILDGITPFMFGGLMQHPNTRLLSFLYTAEYECGSWNGDSEMKALAVQKYAGQVESRREDAAEAELCLLLSYDLYWSGSFEDSLQWILRANRLWQQISSPPAAHLRWEVYVLMKLRRFKEATNALGRLSDAPVHAQEVKRRADEVRRWKQDCETQLQLENSTSDEGHQKPMEDEDLLELQRALEYSNTLASNQGQGAQLPGDIEAATPVIKKIWDEMLTPDLTSVRSWLSIEHFTTIHFHESKFPEGPWVAIFIELDQRLRDNLKQNNFQAAISRLNRCREILRAIKNCIEPEAYYSVLASVDRLLADLYQFRHDRLCQFEIKALETRKELLKCIQHLAASDKVMEKHYMSLVILTEYQGSCSPGGDESRREQIVQSYALLMGLNKEQAECDMCFWLFFRDKSPWIKLIWLKNVMPRWKHSGMNYSFSYPHLQRCEAELLLNFVNFLMEDGNQECDLKSVKTYLELAKGILQDLEVTFEKGQSSYKAWVHSMLEKWYTEMSKYAKATGDNERAENYQEMAVIEKGRHLSLVHEVQKPCSIAVTNTTQLIPVEEHTMEQYYWVRFPPAHYLAFQKLYCTGQYKQDEGDWEYAIFNFELCRDLLKAMKEEEFDSILKKEFDASLAWVDLPLVQLHQMKMKNLKKSLDLRQELRDYLSSLTRVHPKAELTVHLDLHAAVYLFVHSNYPLLKDQIMDEILMKLVPKLESSSAPPFWVYLIHSQEYNTKGSWEHFIVYILVYWHFVHGDYGTALDMIEILKKVVDKNFPERQDMKDQNVNLEVGCLLELKMFQDAALVLKGKRYEKVSKHIQQSIQMCENEISGIHATLFETSKSIALSSLRITGVYCQIMGRYKDAAFFQVQCIRIIEAAKNDPAIMEIVTEYRGQPGWYDYFHLGISYRKMFETRMQRNRTSLWTHPNSSNLEGPSLEDMEFTSAQCSFQKQIKLLVNPYFIARANHEILKLYAAMNESYFGYLLTKYGFLDAHTLHFDHGIADVNNVKLLMEDENHMKKAQLNLTSTEQSILEEVETSMINYGRRTAVQFANSLYAMKGRYTESWINVLEGHKDVYAKLQRHFLNKMFLEALTTPDYNPKLQPKIMDEYRWKAFLYAERQRSRVLLYQLGPQKQTSFVARQLWEFDSNDLHAMETVQAHVAAMEKDSVFVEYNHLEKDVWIIYVLQAGTLSHYILTMKSETKLVKKAIGDVLKRLKRWKGMKEKEEDDFQMNKHLEYLHDLLIKPIARHLCQMKREHKLILAPMELLTKVPFAALRDSTKPDEEKYLVQRHTISLVPSLRAFQGCNERLRVLQELDFHEGPGAIVALGDPTYGRDGQWTVLPKLPETKTEVDDIVGAFSKISVVKLLGEDATAEKLRDWVENPLHKSSRQIIVHIGAHGLVDNHDERNSCLLLARSTAADSSTAGPSTAGKRMLFSEIDMDDEENDDSAGTISENSMNILRDMVNRSIDEVELKSSKEKGKGKNEKEEEDSEEMVKGHEESVQPTELPIAELPIADLIKWAENRREVMIVWNAFVEYPESKTSKSKALPKKYGPHVCSVLALKDVSNSEILWRAELVVLSACHTSEGKATAEGLVNLARAFIIAGVPCVVASQWAILDSSTRKLMKEFYDELRHGNDVASSLRSAMSSMIKRGHHVCEWAPFVIWGSSSLVLPKPLHCEECTCKVCQPPGTGSD